MTKEYFCSEKEMPGQLLSSQRMKDYLEHLLRFTTKEIIKYNIEIFIFSFKQNTEVSDEAI